MKKLTFLILLTMFSFQLQSSVGYCIEDFNISETTLMSNTSLADDLCEDIIQIHYSDFTLIDDEWYYCITYTMHHFCDGGYSKTRVQACSTQY